MMSWSKRPPLQADAATQQQHRRRRRSSSTATPLPRPLLVALLLIFIACVTRPTRAFLLPPSSFPLSKTVETRRFFWGGGGGKRSSSSSSSSSSSNRKPSPFAPELMKTYDDNLFAKVWIFLFSGKIAAVVNAPPPRSFIPYDEYVRLSQLLLKGGSTRAKGAVLAVLRSIAFPGFSSIFRTLFPGTSRFACEFNAKVTPVFFSWLVGPALVETTEMINPKTGEMEVWANSVKIQRCRYLEAVQCKGACANICKLPTQEFFTNDLGMPVTMTPNMEDLSCVMTFGVAPLPFNQDPVAKEPCYKECSTAQTTSKICPKIAAIGKGE